MAFRPILCLDFDGVIHSYTSGWEGAGVCNDPPVPGTAEFLHEATKHFRVMVYSSRSRSLRGRRAMKRYMRRHFAVPLTFSPDHRGDFLHEELEYPWFKPSASVTIDDRALTFEGVWPAVAELRRFKPWNKRPAQGMALSENSRSEVEAEGRQPGSPTGECATPISTKGAPASLTNGA